MRLGLIQHPASSPVNLESQFEDVLSNARKVASGIMAAPPVSLYVPSENFLTRNSD